MKTAVAPLAHEVPPARLDDVVAQFNEVFIEKGTPMFMRTVLALFSGGFATFALLYCVQPMMPMLSHEYGINAAQSSLILSVATAMLAIGLLITGPISDAFGRKPVMVFALFSAGLFTVLLSAMMPTWEGVLITRALVAFCAERPMATRSGNQGGNSSKMAARHRRLPCNRPWSRTCAKG